MNDNTEMHTTLPDHVVRASWSRIHCRDIRRCRIWIIRSRRLRISSAHALANLGNAIGNAKPRDLPLSLAPPFLICCWNLNFWPCALTWRVYSKKPWDAVSTNGGSIFKAQGEQQFMGRRNIYLCDKRIGELFSIGTIPDILCFSQAGNKA